MFAIPDLSHTGCSAAHDLLIHYLCTVGDKEIVRIYSASPVSDKCNLWSAPILIFYSWKWFDLVLDKQGCQPVCLWHSTLLYFILSLTDTHIYHIKIGQCTLHVSVNQSTPRQRRIEPIIHGRLLQGMIIGFLHDHRTQALPTLLTKTAPFWIRLFSYLRWFCAD